MQRTTVQAEAYAEGSGVATHAAGTGSVLGGFDGGDWVRYDDVDFGTGRDLLVANIDHFSVQKAISQ
ncbi:carbohydrate-binding protein [Streptomyces sp. CA-100214]